MFLWPLAAMQRHMQRLSGSLSCRHLHLPGTGAAA
jgi:hypothetical protein